MSASIASAVASSIKRKPDESWLRRGQDIARHVSRQQWEIGDWLVEGHEKWERSAYDAAERIFPEYTRPTLRNLAYVARSVKHHDRSDVLSWSHHEAIAGMKPDKQRELLAYAADKHLSFAAFRRHLHALEDKRIAERMAEQDAKLSPAERAAEERELESFAKRIEQATREREHREEQFRQHLAEQSRINERQSELAKEIVHEGRRGLAKKHHPDRGGSNDAMAELNLVTEWLVKLIDEGD